MSFKINRIKTETERYSNNPEWLNDFTKSANFIDRIRERKDLKQEEKFATIEEKMADIKLRIGYGNSVDTVIKSASCGCEMKNKCDCPQTMGCGCGKDSCDICSTSTFDDNEVNMMVSILKYILGILNEFPSMLPAQVLNMCRRDISGFDESKFSRKKIEDFINKNRNLSGLQQNMVESYIPLTESHDFGEDIDNPFE